MSFLPRLFCAGLLLVLPLSAAEPAAPAPVAELGVGDAIVLGVVEGVTEFLPISSTGHLIIANRVLGLESTAQLKDPQGRPLWHKPPSPRYPDGVPLTLKLAADTYAVVIQVGAIAAVVFLYWQQFFLMLGGLLGRSSAGLRLLRNVMLAFLPIAFTGFLLHDLIDRYLFSLGTVIVALVAGAILMLWAERWRDAHTGVGRAKGDAADLTPRKAIGIGLFQCIALWPGTSRSMVTIVGGYLAGLSPAKAAEFSFLVGLPTLAGAAVYKGFRSGSAMIEVFGWSHVLLGGAVAAISALIAVKFLVHIISRHGLALFAYYRLALAALLALFYLL
ncbi:Undecaprenyl-diphosphatase [Lacunisphaera limnophila]|uniref:Undecaprenyl-diphosphatase n=1 Tax=Lacunisphaera limnophila TaxID=1838286 RepID=A0A1D8AWZ4_9BACT|nr:undecaprenyl-diphosphate phosphatase [Lacunisphaera limnophila]AOS45412.1 Undecaprenyl-diphosphatase [Lacunisphaera limnophila]